MKFTFKSLLFAAGLLVGSVNAWADDVTLSPTDDSYLDWANKDSNYGESASLYCGIWQEMWADATPGLKRNSDETGHLAIFKFNVSDYAGKITAATFKVTGTNPSTNTNTRSIYLGYFDLADWSESSVTVNNSGIYEREKNKLNIHPFGISQSIAKGATTEVSFSNDAFLTYLNEDEDGIVSLIVYSVGQEISINSKEAETGKPQLVLTYTNETLYTATFTESAGLNPTVTIYSDEKKTDMVSNGTLTTGKTYYYTASLVGYYDYEGTFKVEGADPSIQFTMKAKPVYSYTVTSSYNGKTLAWSATGTAYEGESVKIWYPRYQADGQTLVGRAPVSNNLTTTITMTEDYTMDLEYKSEGIDNLYLLSEAEDLNTGLPTSSPSSFTDRCSNKTIIYGTAGKLLSLPAGKYILTLGVIGAPNNGQTDYTVSAGENQIISDFCDGNTLKLLVSEEFTLLEETDITFTCPNSNSTRGIDLVYVQKTGDIAISSANLQGYKTFYNASANYEVDDNTTIYTAAVNEKKDAVLLTKVAGKVVPKGNAVLLQTIADDYIITLTPTAEEGEGDFEGNELKAADEAGEQENAYILARTNANPELAFYKYGGKLEAGDVYLTIENNPAGIKSIAIAGDDTATAIETVEAENAADGALYNVAGQQVGSDYKGIVIKNGKKYLNK